MVSSGISRKSRESTRSKGYVSMRVLIQRVSRASVSVEQNKVALIGRGLLALVAFTEGDTIDNIKWIVNKIAKLRIFPDEVGKMNKCVSDIGGEILAVSQFTLYGDVTDGNRPSFTRAMEPLQAEDMYQKFLTLLSETTGEMVKSGIFGANMTVDLVNDGPVTIMLER